MRQGDMGLSARCSRSINLGRPRGGIPKLLAAVCLTALPGLWAQAQNSPPPVTGLPDTRIEATIGNYHTSLPGLGAPGLFYRTWHPGLSVAYERALSRGPRHEWLLRGRLEGFYHRFIQVGIPLTVGGVWHWRPTDGRFGIELGLNLGYMHSLPLTRSYRRTADGDYRRAYPVGRPQAWVSPAMGLTYRLDREDLWRLVARYQVALQTPFVPGYVLLLPYNIFQLGVSRGLTMGRAGQSRNPKDPQ